MHRRAATIVDQQFAILDNRRPSLGVDAAAVVRKELCGIGIFLKDVIAIGAAGANALAAHAKKHHGQSGQSEKLES